MPRHFGPSAARAGQIADGVRVLAWLLLAVVLMVLDQRGGWMRAVHAQATRAVEPLWRVVDWPLDTSAAIGDWWRGREQLQSENRQLQVARERDALALQRVPALEAENQRLRALLDAAATVPARSTLAPVLDVALGGDRQRLLLGIGANRGVRVGQPVMDSGGLLGQVMEVAPRTATVLLLTDPDHAVPVLVARSGVRLIVYGRGRERRLRVANVPLTGDVRIGDQLLTSGLGGRFPAGLPVGRVTALAPDDSRAFLVGDVVPAAHLDVGREVLLLDPAQANPLPLPAPAPVPVPASPATHAAMTTNGHAVPATSAMSGTEAASAANASATHAADRHPTATPAPTRRAPVTQPATPPAATSSPSAAPTAEPTP